MQKPEKEVAMPTACPLNVRVKKRVSMCVVNAFYNMLKQKITKALQSQQEHQKSPTIARAFHTRIHSDCL